MKLPEPTHGLLKRLRRTAVLLETVADNATNKKTYTEAKANALTVWQAIDRIEDLAGILEELAPSLDADNDGPAALTRSRVPDSGSV